MRWFRRRSNHGSLHHQLITWIREGSSSAVKALSKVEDFCVHEEHYVTPLNTVIRHHNKAVLELIVVHRAALDFAPALDKDVRKS